MAELIAVLLVDDHPLVIDGLVGRFRAEPDFDPVVDRASVVAAADALSHQQFDVVVCDVRLPDGSGFELLEMAGGLPRPPAFVMLSSFDTPQYVDAALKLGASGFLLKTAPPEELVAAVRRAHVGGTSFDLRLVRRGAEMPWRALTPRERDVVAGLIRGRSNDEIAGDLAISRKTVEAYLSRLFARAGAMSRTELAVRAERERWLDMPPIPPGMR